MSDEIDFSNEGLGIGVEPEAEEAVVEAPEPEVVEEAAPEPEVEDAPEPVAEETPEPVSEEETYRQRYESLVGKLGEQGRELGELRRLREEFEAFRSAQSQPEPAAPQINGWQPTTAEELLEGAADPAFAVQAFNVAVEQAPNMIPDVLAEVSFHDPALAKRMELSYIQQQFQSQLAPVAETLTRSQAEAQVAQAVEATTGQIEGFDQIRDEVAQIIQDEEWLLGDGSPEAVARGINAAARMAKANRDAAVQTAAAQQAAQGLQQRQQAAVETGTPSAAPVVEEPDATQSIADAIFQQDEQRRRAMNL